MHEYVATTSKAPLKINFAAADKTEGALIQHPNLFTVCALPRFPKSQIRQQHQHKHVELHVDHTTFKGVDAKHAELRRSSVLYNKPAFNGRAQLLISPASTPFAISLLADM